MASILIKSGRVWDGGQFLHADVLTDGEKVLKSEPNISENAEFIYDATGKTVRISLPRTAREVFAWTNI